MEASGIQKKNQRILGITGLFSFLFLFYWYGTFLGNGLDGFQFMAISVLPWESH
jgi:apolipoprotein N-acyltransferase